MSSIASGERGVQGETRITTHWGGGVMCNSRVCDVEDG